MYHVKKIEVNRKSGDRKKTCSYKYSFKMANGEQVPVCKTFFLTTLGYQPTNDTIITNIFKSIDFSRQGRTMNFVDGRGGSKNSKAIDQSKIKAHIDTYGPEQPHY